MTLKEWRNEPNEFNEKIKWLEEQNIKDEIQHKILYLWLLKNKSQKEIKEIVGLDDKKISRILKYYKKMNIN